MMIPPFFNPLAPFTFASAYSLYAWQAMTLYAMQTWMMSMTAIPGQLSALEDYLKRINTGAKP